MAELDKVVKGLETCRTRTHCKECPYIYDPRADDSYCEAVLHNDALELLKEQKPKTGEWIEQEDYDFDIYYDCSVCGESWTMIDGTPWENGMNYCPHCGAKMEGV